MQEVLDAMFERTVQAGDYVIRQGDDGDNFYVIDSGAFHIYVASDAEALRLVGQYSGSGSFGELALMYNMPRAATVQVSSRAVSIHRAPHQRQSRVVTIDRAAI